MFLSFIHVFALLILQTIKGEARLVTIDHLFNFAQPDQLIREGEVALAGRRMPDVLQTSAECDVTYYNEDIPDTEPVYKTELSGSAWRLVGYQCSNGQRALINGQHICQDNSTPRLSAPMNHCRWCKCRNERTRDVQCTNDWSCRWTPNKREEHFKLMVANRSSCAEEDKIVKKLKAGLMRSDPSNNLVCF